MAQKLSDILVLADMDGTLLNEEKVLLGCNAASIRLFTTLGGRFSIATGRVAESVARYKEILDCLSPSVTSGGCVLYDFAQGRALQNELLPRVVAKRVLNEVLRVFPKVGVLIFGGDGRNYQLVASGYTQKLVEDERITYFLHPKEELPPDWNKVLFAGPTALMEDVEDYVSQHHYPGVYFVRTDPFYFEMMPAGVSKGSALIQLSALLGVPVENTIAIGDYYNDIDMMKEAGLSVAMENAPSEVKLLAGQCTGHCNSGGVGQFLYSLVKKYEP